MVELARQVKLLTWGDEPEMVQEPPAGAKVLCTIGYGGRNPSELVRMLQANSITLLMDVRASPNSRIPGFSSRSMSSYIPSAGIGYLHVNDLGNVNRKNPGAGAVLVNEERGMATLLTAIEERSKVAILCACRRYYECHRSHIADLAIERLPGLVVNHIQ